MVGGIRCVQGVLLGQKRLKLSRRVDECEPLPTGTSSAVALFLMKAAAATLILAAPVADV